MHGVGQTSRNKLTIKEVIKEPLSKCLKPYLILICPQKLINVSLVLFEMLHASSNDSCYQFGLN